MEIYKRGQWYWMYGVIGNRYVRFALDTDDEETAKRRFDKCKRVFDGINDKFFDFKVNKIAGKVKADINVSKEVEAICEVCESRFKYYIPVDNLRLGTRKLCDSCKIGNDFRNRSDLVKRILPAIEEKHPKTGAARTSRKYVCQECGETRSLRGRGRPRKVCPGCVSKRNISVRKKKEGPTTLQKAVRTAIEYHQLSKEDGDLVVFHKIECNHIAFLMGIGVSAQEAAYVWKWHSTRLNANWLEASIYDKDRIQEILSDFLSDFKGGKYGG